MWYFIDYTSALQLEDGYTAPPAARSGQGGGGRGRGRGRTDESLVTVTGYFPRETVGTCSCHVPTTICLLLLAKKLLEHQNIAEHTARPTVCCLPNPLKHQTLQSIQQGPQRAQVVCPSLTTGEQGAASALQRAVGQPQNSWATAGS